MGILDTFNVPMYFKHIYIYVHVFIIVDFFELEKHERSAIILLSKEYVILDHGLVYRVIRRYICICAYWKMYKIRLERGNSALKYFEHTNTRDAPKTVLFRFPNRSCTAFTEPTHLLHTHTIVGFIDHPFPKYKPPSIHTYIHIYKYPTYALSQVFQCVPQSSFGARP